MSIVALLGALVTRLAVLFTSSGPAMTISSSKQKKPDTIKEPEDQ